MVILGRSGAGKTYTTQIIMHRSMHIGRVVASLDWKGEHKDFFLLVVFRILNLMNIPLTALIRMM